MRTYIPVIQAHSRMMNLMLLIEVVLIMVSVCMVVVLQLPCILHVFAAGKAHV